MKGMKKSVCLILAFALVLTSALFVLPTKAWAVDYQSLAPTCAIEADVTLKTTPGSGSHAKLVVGTATAAVSFGIQYDTACGQAEYRGVPAFMFENVLSPSSQDYSWVGRAARDKTFRIRLCYQKKGYVWAYVDGNYIGGVTNKSLKGKAVTMRAEAAVRVQGDKVDASFADIVPYWKSAPEKSEHGGWAYNAWYGGKRKPNKKALKIQDIGYGVRIFGTAKFGGDWDSNPTKATSLIQVY
ncbi:MAG: hypothetical protein IJT05_07790 [Lachnospiraceae bacterium]|nr:hypothetical protein [Lachnospiraceae bacterium]